VVTVGTLDPFST